MEEPPALVGSAVYTFLFCLISNAIICAIQLLDGSVSGMAALHCIAGHKVLATIIYGLGLGVERLRLEGADYAGFSFRTVELATCMLAAIVLTGSAISLATDAHSQLQQPAENHRPVPLLMVVVLWLGLAVGLCQLGMFAMALRKHDSNVNLMCGASHVVADTLRTFSMTMVPYLADLAGYNANIVTTRAALMTNVLVVTSGSILVCTIGVRCVSRKQVAYKPLGTSDGPQCKRKHRMVLSTYDGPGYSIGYKCDICKARSSQGHRGGSRERWYCSVCEEDICLECHPAATSIIEPNKSTELFGVDVNILSATTTHSYS